MSRNMGCIPPDQAFNCWRLQERNTARTGPLGQISAYPHNGSKQCTSTSILLSYYFRVFACFVFCLLLLGSALFFIKFYLLVHTFLESVHLLYFPIQNKVTLEYESATMDKKKLSVHHKYALSPFVFLGYKREI